MVSAAAERVATPPVAASVAPPPPLAILSTATAASAAASAATPSPPASDSGVFLTLPPAVAVRVVTTPAGVTAAVADLRADAAASVAAGTSPALLVGVDAEWRPTALRAAAVAAAATAEAAAKAPTGANGGGGVDAGRGVRKAKPSPPPPTAAVLQLASHGLAVVVDIPAVRAAAGGDAALAAAVGGALFRDASTAKVGWNFGADLRVLAATFGDDAWPARLDAYVDAGELVEVYRPAAAAAMMGGGSAASSVAAAAAAASAATAPGAVPPTPAAAPAARHRGLGGAAAAVLGAGLDKGAQCSDWEARPLSAAQVAYAALDAHVLVSLAEALLPAGPPPQAGAPPRHHSIGELTPASKPLSTLSGGTRGGGGGGGSGGATGTDGQRYQFRSSRKRAAFIARFAVKRPVYDNCVIQGASGVPLAYCDRKKLDWYIAKGLGRRVDVAGDGGPPTLRLAFEPTRKTPVWEDDDDGAVGGGGSSGGSIGGGGSGCSSSAPGGASHRAAGNGGGCDGDDGRDAAAAAAVGTSLSSLALSDARINRCVVCGATRDYTRYHVVPAAYRKHLPAAIKAHRSHDIVLVCVDCHEGANGLYAAQRRVLAAEYGAPLEGEGANGPSRAHLRVRKAARTLANPVAARCMPVERKRRMVAAVRAALAASAAADEAAAAVVAATDRGRSGQPRKGNHEDRDGDGDEGNEDEDEDEDEGEDEDEVEDVVEDDGGCGKETEVNRLSEADSDEVGGGSDGETDGIHDRPVSAAALVALRAEAARTTRAFEVAVEALLSRPPAGGGGGGSSSAPSAAVTDSSVTPPGGDGAAHPANGDNADADADADADAEADALTPAEHAVAIRLGADARRDFATHGELVVRRLLGAPDPRSAVRAFIRRWRAYFVAALAPGYLPPDWSADAELTADFVLWPDDDYERHCAAVRAAHAAEVATSRAAAAAAAATDGKGAAGGADDAGEVDDAGKVDDARGGAKGIGAGATAGATGRHPPPAARP